MNAELVKKAMEKVLNQYVLVNLVSRRVRQLNAGAGRISRPLVLDTANLGLADIALREIIEDKIGFEMPEFVELTRPTGRNRRRPQGWEKPHAAKGNAAG
jgi:DNA-directed RNA polymerase subunit omega